MHFTPFRDERLRGVETCTNIESLRTGQDCTNNSDGVLSREIFSYIAKVSEQNTPVII